MLTWNQFTAIPNGTQVLNHGWDQCVALANLYHEDVIGGSFVAVPSAFQWWTEFDRYATLTQNYTRSASPVAGAIFVSRYGLYDAPNGHIGVVTKVHANGSFDTMEQNAGTWRHVGRYTRGMANMLGFLIPKNNPATPAASKPVATNRKKNHDMFALYFANARPASTGFKGSWAFTGSKYWKTINNQAAANQLATQLGIKNAYICRNKAEWDAFRKAAK